MRLSLPLQPFLCFTYILIQLSTGLHKSNSSQLSILKCCIEDDAKTCLISYACSKVHVLSDECVLLTCACAIASGSLFIPPLPQCRDDNRDRHDSSSVPLKRALPTEYRPLLILQHEVESCASPSLPPISSSGQPRVLVFQLKREAPAELPL